MKPTEKSATIKDVAKYAGLSVGTVSNIVNGKGHLHNPETIRRTREAIRVLGYRPSHLARCLAMGRTMTIGVWWQHTTDTLEGTLSRDRFVGRILEGVMAATVEVGYSLKFVVDQHPNVCQFDESSVDGVLLIAPVVGSPLLTWAKQTSLPVVVAGDLPADCTLPGVDIDDAAAVRTLVEELIGLGHRRIGIITGNPLLLSAHRREQAYREALAAAGIDAPPEWRFEGNYWTDLGNAGAKALAQVTPALTAIVCGNDWTAVGALEALRQLNLDVPRDISLVGFDDAEIAKFIIPPLTTVTNPTIETGRTAAEMLLRLIDGQPLTTPRVIFPATIVHRYSVAPPTNRNRMT